MDSNEHRWVFVKRFWYTATASAMVLALLACLAIVASAQYHGQYEHKEHYAHPKYKFEYGVKDPHTGDHKTQWEIRDGDVVKGAYTLHEADGTERVVEYKSDGHNGFEANVKNSLGILNGVINFK
uniref:Cuticle protein 19 n=1 Tax=Anopheles farauti TaxID=69004 RepID=A0A182QBX5_9DIPT